jgi:hypothetical protein
MNADSRQLYELACSWPPSIREAFFATYHQLVSADWAHFGLLGLAKPRHALLWVEGFAGLERSRATERQPIAAVERYFMTARTNQPFIWGDEGFTCAHRAVLSMADRIAHLISRAMSPAVIHIPHIPETNGEEEWKAAYVQLAQTCGLLDGQRQAGEEWTPFCERYREQTDKVAWDHKAADALQTALLLEANGAASLVPHNQGGAGQAATIKGTQRETPEGRMSFPNDNYSLVGERCPNGPIVGRRLSVAGMALVRLGFPPDWWMPPEVARCWKTILFPLTPTADSVRQWRDAQQDVARYTLGIQGNHKADEYYSDLDNDLALIRGHSPELMAMLAPNEGTGSTDADQASRLGEGQWLTVTQAARVAGCNSGVITAAVNNGKLRSNGKPGRDRRIDPADLSRWQLARAERAEPGETEAAIRRKLDNAARSDLRSKD